LEKEFRRSNFRRERVKSIKKHEQIDSMKNKTVVIYCILSNFSFSLTRLYMRIIEHTSWIYTEKEKEIFGRKICTSLSSVSATKWEGHPMQALS
jgi:hypothetical protein